MDTVLARKIHDYHCNLEAIGMSNYMYMLVYVCMFRVYMYTIHLFLIWLITRVCEFFL